MFLFELVFYLGFSRSFFPLEGFFSQGFFLGGFEPWPPKFLFVGSRLGFSLSVLDVCCGFRWMLVVVVLVWVMAGSVVPVPIVIFVICDAGCIAYCHHLMMVVACTAGLIANCDSYLVHCVCMQGCMFRE